MRKALKRGGLLLIATGIVALAYHVGNLSSPSIPYEPTPYEASDLEAPTPIAEGSSMVESQSLPSGELNQVGETGRRARIISVTAVPGFNQSRRNAPIQSLTVLKSQSQERRPLWVEVVNIQVPPSRQPSGATAVSRTSFTQTNHLNDPTRQVGAKRQAVIDSEANRQVGAGVNRPTSGNPAVTAHAVVAPGTVAPARHEEAVKQDPGRNTPSAPASSPSEMPSAFDPPRVLPRVLPDVQEMPVSETTPVPARIPSRSAPPTMLPATTYVPSRPEISPAAKTGAELIGMVFRDSAHASDSPVRQSPRPPRELPASVMESAPLQATQKLIARSLGSPSGVAARLADTKPSSPGAAKGGLVLASALLEDQQTGPQLDDSALRPYTTTGVVRLRAPKEQIAAQAHLDYVTSGLVILPDAQEPRITPPVSVQERFLKNVIQMACGDKIKNLQVALQPDHGLKICLNAANDTEREALTRTIITLPELAPYQLNFSVEVAP